MTDWAAVEERKRERRVQRSRAALNRANQVLLDTPEAQPILARVGAAIDPDYPHRMEHAKQVTLVVLAVRHKPRHERFDRITTAARGSIGEESATGGRQEQFR